MDGQNNQRYVTMTGIYKLFVIHSAYVGRQYTISVEQLHKKHACENTYFNKNKEKGNSQNQQQTAN